MNVRRREVSEFINFLLLFKIAIVRRASLSPPPDHISNMKQSWRINKKQTTIRDLARREVCL